MATTGRSPPIAMPAADGHRVLLGDADVEEPVGEALLERQQAGRVGHGGGDRHQLGPVLGLLDDRLGERRGVGARLDFAQVVQPLDRVLLGRLVAPALLGAHVDHDRAVVLGRVAQRALHPGDVVAVERARVAHAQHLEERRRLEHLAQGRQGALDAPLQLVADDRDLVQQPVEPRPIADVGRVEPDAPQALAQLGHRGRVAAAVVVEDDDHPAVGVAQVVQALERHAPGEAAVADDRDDLAVVDVAHPERLGQPVRVAEDGRRVAVLDPVVVGLLAAGVAGQAARLAQARELLAPPGHHLVDVGQVADVPEDDVTGRVENPVHGEGQLDDAQVRAQVAAAGRRHRGDDAVADLDGQLVELFVAEAAQIRGVLDRLEEHAAAPATLGGHGGWPRAATNPTARGA